MAPYLDLYIMNVLFVWEFTMNLNSEFQLESIIYNNENVIIFFLNDVNRSVINTRSV